MLLGDLAVDKRREQRQMCVVARLVDYLRNRGAVNGRPKLTPKFQFREG